MSDTYNNIRLPNGRVVELNAIPFSLSQAELQDKLIRNGLATAEEFEEPVNPEELSWLEKNMELPVGLGGALGGAAAGFAVGGPPGAVIGGIVMGAIGSGTGSLISDKLSGKELDYAEAAEEALISAGFDIATLGLSKVLKPSYYAAKAAMGYTTKEVAEDVVNIARSQIAKQTASETTPTAGSLDSLRQSQDILQQATDPASLSKFQTGKASGAEVFSEKIAEMGIASSGIMAENAVKVNRATKEALNDVVNKAGSSQNQGSEQLGQSMFEVLAAGKDAAQEIYGIGLTDLSKRVSRKTVSTGLITKKLNKFLEKGNRKTFSIYDNDTIKYVDDLLEGGLSVNRLTARTLLDLDKKIAADIRAFSNPNLHKVYNPKAAIELGELTVILKESFINTLKQADPRAAIDYKALKEAYGSGMKGMLPDINKSFVVGATKENFNSLGKMLNSGVKSSNARAMLASIDEAYKQIGKTAKGSQNITYATADTAKEAVKQSYLTSLMPMINDEAFNINEYARLAARFSKPDEDAMLKLVAGKDYSRVKQVFNLMSDASKKPDGSMGTLILRGKEFGALGQAGQTMASGIGVGATVAGGGVLPLLAGVAVIVGPRFLAKAATNPKAVNKLLAFEKMTFKNDTARENAAALIIAEVMDGMTTEEQAEFRNEHR